MAIILLLPFMAGSDLKITATGHVGMKESIIVDD